MDTETPRARRRRLRRQKLAPWWRRISWIRVVAVLFCLAVWVVVAHACLSLFAPA